MLGITRETEDSPFADSGLNSRRDRLYMIERKCGVSSNRQTDCNIWDKEFFHRLDPELKIHWFYIKDKCDVAGIWEIRQHKFEPETGVRLRLKEFVKYVNGQEQLVQTDEEKRVEILPGGKHLWIVGYCMFHYPNGLSQHVRPYVGVIAKLNEWKLMPRVLMMYQNRGKIPPPESGLFDLPTPADFDQFWDKYPRKVGKVTALKSWQKIRPPLDRVIAALGWQLTSPDWVKNDGQFIPYPATYLNDRRWEDQPMQRAEIDHTKGF